MPTETMTYDAAKLSGLRRTRMVLPTRKRLGLRDRLTRLRAAGAFKKGPAR
jgi:hypothetical protein